MHSRRVVLLCILAAILVFAWLIRRNFLSPREPPAPPLLTIDKQPVAFASHTFDLNSPPADMPALAYGEEALCDSNFSSDAEVGGQSQKIDATHATVTITSIKIILRLSINIWVPAGATQHVVEHEDGHRQISQFYYQTADKLAQRIAAAYMGQQFDVSGADLSAQIDKVLRQAATDITSQYDNELPSGAAQQYFDLITDHGRNDVAVKRAVAAAVANTKVASLTSPAN